MFLLVWCYEILESQVNHRHLGAGGGGSNRLRKSAGHENKEACFWPPPPPPGHFLHWALKQTARMKPNYTFYACAPLCFFSIMLGKFKNLLPKGPCRSGKQLHMEASENHKQTDKNTNFWKQETHRLQKKIKKASQSKYHTFKVKYNTLPKITFSWFAEKHFRPAGTDPKVGDGLVWNPLPMAFKYTFLDRMQCSFSWFLSSSWRLTYLKLPNTAPNTHFPIMSN